jgi:hypothetical protein
MRVRMLRWVAALAGLAVVVAAGAVVLWPREGRITQENYDRISEGMSCAEVEAILGPPGDYRTGLGETGFAEPKVWSPDRDIAPRPVSNWSTAPGQSPPWASWMSDSFVIWIGIDDSGSVGDKLGYPRRTTQGPLDNLLWRAKRQWRCWFPE